MELKLFSNVKLKDGTIGALVDIWDSKSGKGCAIDIGDNPETWDTIYVGSEDIAEIID